MVAFRILPYDQLIEVLLAPKEQVGDLFIGGFVDTESQVLILMRSDLSQLFVPFSVFRVSDISEPNFRRFEIIDHGQTIRLGEYETGSNFILDAMNVS